MLECMIKKIDCKCNSNISYLILDLLSIPTCSPLLHTIRYTQMTIILYILPTTIVMRYTYNQSSLSGDHAYIVLHLECLKILNN